MNRLACVVLADDLTGACDAAVHFAIRGYRTEVAVSIEHAAAGQAEVLAVNLESRELPREEIGRAIEGARAVLQPGPETIIFKKIDSTLRGNAGVEAMASMRAFGCEAAVFTPALPAMGRVVEGGILRCKGFDRFAPVHVEAWLRAQGAAGCVAPDAACDEDLDRIVADALRSGKRILWAGSAGLAAAVARAMPEVGDGGQGTGDGGSCGPAGRVVFGIGSTHSVTVAQVEALRAARDQAIVLEIPRGTPEAAIREWMGASPPALVLSGGDTAALVCRAMGAALVELRAEIVPGIPWGVLRGGALDGVLVATKSGGFGAPDALIQVADFFRCPQA